MVAEGLKKAAVRVVKPRVSPQKWDALRRARTPAAAVAALRTAPPPPPAPKPAARKPAAPQKTLAQLAKQFHTDKWGTHKYAPHYQHHLGPWRRKRFTLFEIGIGPTIGKGRVAGASLRMWKAFFPRAQIVGLDIFDRLDVAEPRIHAYQGDQTDETVLRKIMAEHPDIQIIVDDGSHQPEHIRATFAVLFPLLPPGGMYAIEDIQTSYWPEWGGSEDRNDPNTTLGLVKGLVDGLNYEEFVEPGYEPTYTDLNVVAVHAYHNLVFIQKGTNVEGTNKERILKKRYAPSTEAPAEATGTPESTEPPA